MNLVHDHELEVGEEASPPAVIRENALVKHVGVGQDEVGLRAQLPPRCGRRIAVIGSATDELGEPGVGVREAAEPPHLVLGEGLRGKEVEGLGLRPGEQPLQHREVVAERLAARCARDDGGVNALAQMRYRRGLVRVKPADVQVRERLAKRFGQLRREVAEDRIPPRNLLDVHDLAGVVGG